MTIKSIYAAPGGNALSPNLVVDDDTGSSALNAELVAHLALLDPSVNPCVSVAGSATAGDKGGGTFDKCPNTETTDNALIFNSSNAAWKWKRRYSGAVDLGWWGGKLDNVTNDRPALVLCAASFPAESVTVRIDGQCSVATDYTVPSNILVRFDGPGAFVGAGVVTFTGWAGSARGVGNSGVELYVKPGGSDVSDGLTWATAKATVIAAVAALPLTGGTVHVADSSYMGGWVAGQGLRLMGVGCPSFGTPGYPGGANPTLNGWLQTRPLRMIGHGPAAEWFWRKPIARINGGTPAAPGYAQDADNPVIWITDPSGVTARFENLDLGYAYRSVCLGVPPGRVIVPANDACSGMTFESCYLHINASLLNPAPSAPPGMGPAVEIRGGWKILFSGCYFYGIGPWYAAGAGYAPHGFSAGQRAAGILCTDSAGVEVHDCNAVYGHIDYTCGGNGNALYVDNLIVESDGTHATDSGVHIRYSNCDNGFQGVLKGVEVADAPGTPATIIVEPVTAPPEAVLVEDCFGCTGPMTHRQATLPAAATELPSNQRQVGMFGRRLSAQHDGEVRSAAPAVARFQNRVTAVPASGGTITVTTGQLDPWGGTTAFKIESSIAGADTCYLVYEAQAVAVGDRLAYAAMVRCPSGPYDVGVRLLDAALDPGGTNMFDTGNGAIPLAPSITGDGEWWTLRYGATVATAATPAGTLIVRVVLNNAHPVIICEPTVHYIATGVISNNEFSEFVQHMPTLPLNAEPNEAYSHGSQRIHADILVETDHVLPIVPTAANIATALEQAGICFSSLPYTAEGFIRACGSPDAWTTADILAIYRADEVAPGNMVDSLGLAPDLAPVNAPLQAVVLGAAGVDLTGKLGIQMIAGAGPERFDIGAGNEAYGSITDLTGSFGVFLLMRRTAAMTNNSRIVAKELGGAGIVWLLRARNLPAGELAVYCTSGGLANDYLTGFVIGDTDWHANALSFVGAAGPAVTLSLTSEATTVSAPFPGSLADAANSRLTIGSGNAAALSSEVQIAYVVLTSRAITEAMCAAFYANL
jgi:hypothetical protein